MLYRTSSWTGYYHNLKNSYYWGFFASEFEILRSFYRRNKGDTLNLVLQDLYCLHSRWHTHCNWPLAVLRSSFIKQKGTKSSSIHFLAQGRSLLCPAGLLSGSSVGFLCSLHAGYTVEQLHVCTPPHSSGSFPVIQQSKGGARLSTCTATLLNSPTHTEQV